MIAPASEAALLKNLPGAPWTAAQHLSVAPVQAKSVPTFCLKRKCREKSGGQGERSPCHRLDQNVCNFRSIRRTRLPSARRERYIGEGGAPRSESIIIMIAGGNHTTIYGWDARERGFQRLSYADFFGYFLVRRQESNIPPASQKGIPFLQTPFPMHLRVCSA